MAESSVLPREGVRLGLTAADKWDAIRQCGAVLTELGAVEDGYPDAMLEQKRDDGQQSSGPVERLQHCVENLRIELDYLGCEMESAQQDLGQPSGNRPALPAVG